MAAGSWHSLAIKTDGTLWAWGSNSNGQLGDGTTTNRLSPVQIGTGTNWSKIAAGEDFSIALRADGTLWAWGVNSSGQIGDGSTTQRNNPVQIGTATDWGTIGCGGRHTLAVKTNGELYAWGYNGDRQLGDGTGTNRLAPVRIGTASDWTKIDAGPSHSVALKTDGSLWTWGSNYSDSVLGTPTTGYTSSPARVGAAAGWTVIGGAGRAALKLDGTLWTWGDSDARLGRIPDRPSPLVSLGSGVRMASAGNDNSFVIKPDNTLWAAGYNGWFMLGDGTLTNRFTPVQIGTDNDWLAVRGSYTFTLALKNNGTLWSWGISNSGQTGNGIGGNQPTPQQVGTSTIWSTMACGGYQALALRTDGTLWGWGGNWAGQVGNGTQTDQGTPVQIGTATNWSKIACGDEHSLAVKSDGTLWAWGSNGTGQLGDGTTTSRTAPAQVGTDTDWLSVAGGGYHTVALKTNGTLWAWGSNGSGELGDPTLTSDQLVPVQIGSANNWTSIACYGSGTVALKADGSAWVWGQNNLGQAGNGAVADIRSPARVGSSKVWRAIAAESTRCGHMLLVALDGSVWGFGTNARGALLDGGVRSWSPGAVFPAPADQTVSFPSLPALTAGIPVALSATASSGLPVTFGVAGPATLIGNVITRTGSGLIEVMASQAGDAVWTSAQPVLLSSGPELVVEQPAGSPLTNGFSTLDAGTVLVGQSAAALTVTLRNGGGTTLTGLTLTKDGSQPGDFVLSSPGTTTLASGAVATFTITFTPAASGARTARLRIASSDANDNPFDIALTGFAQAAEIAVTDFTSANVNDGGTVNFGTSVPVSTTITRSFTISNSGNINLTGLAVTLDGVNANQYSLATAPPSSIAPGASGSFSVSCTPTSTGVKAAALHIANNDADENPFDINLSTTGILSTNADLSLLTLSAGTLSPSFNSSTLAYSASVTNPVSSITVTPQSANGTSTITVNGAAVTSGTASGAITLTTGSNLITIVSTAQAGSPSKTYTVNLTRLAAASGDTDAAFDPGASSTVYTLAMQPDGKTVVGGAFTTIAGTGRNRIARLNSDGSIDAAFNPNANSDVSSVVIQPDGRTLIGGTFSTIGGVTRSRVARLDTTGALESTFDPNVTGGSFVRVMVLQPDGKIVLGGSFTTVGGVSRLNLARINADGTLDASFNPGANGTVDTIVRRADGSILVGGLFTNIAGSARNRIARLNSDGSIDAAFNPGSDGEVTSLALQADGKIVACGSFANIAGVARNRIARLSADGSPDSSLNPNASSTPSTTCLQTDGRIITAGQFTTIGGTARNRIARLNADGTLDSGFNPDANNDVRCLAQQADGKILLGGGFSVIGGIARSRLARLDNGIATQALSVPTLNRVQWLRGGTSPEADSVSFEVSTDGGANWSPLGEAVRIAGGWELSGLSLPGSGRVRGRARIPCGYSNGSSGLLEGIAIYNLAAPEIAVEQPAGQNLADGAATIDFGGLPVGGEVTRVFTIRNIGTADLTGVGLTILGADAASFTRPVDPAASIPAGGSTTFSIKFSPASVASYVASLRIASNDADENPFDISLIGAGLTPNQAWLQSYFGGTSGTGNAAPTADPNGNGIPNLVEYALGGDPVGSTTGKEVLPDISIDPTDHCTEFSLTRYVDRNDITLTVQASDSLTGPWTDLARSVNGAAFSVLTPGAIVHETGSGPTRSVTVCDIYQTTDAAHPRRFMRLEVMQ